MLGVGGLMMVGVTVSILLPFLPSSLFPPSQVVSAASDTCSNKMESSLVRQWDENGRVKPWGEDYFGTAGKELIQEMSAQNIEDNLRYLTSQGHMAGTQQDLEQALYLQKSWEEAGLDQVTLKPYDVQLSHPDVNQPNKVYLLDETGEVKFQTSIFEDGSYDDSIPPAFLAFSPAATVHTDELVYVNYGQYEDFLKVEAAGIGVAGRLVIAKYGRGFRGDKIQNAQRFNASGIILYTDPSDYHPEWQNGGPAYPTTFWLPGSGIQRGSIVWHDGDPTTPLYPALEGAYRVPDEEADVPRIPAHCISYNDALKLLVNMGGEEVPEDWKGGLNITYRMGPQLARTGWTIKLEVNNVKHIVPTYNVLGLIRGSEEPDRYVIYGNHRDAWTFGSCDPSSATAVMMEMVRAYGKLMSEGWRPRRSIIFGSWGAGEYGFFGTTELVEEYLPVLGARAVAHLNVDLAIIQTYNLLISATPLMHKIIKEATKRTPAPDTSLGFSTLWEHWTQRRRASSPALMDYALASLSEHTPFYQMVGVPTSYMLWEIDFDEYDWSDYPLYHTTFEDFDAMKNILDPEFRYHLALGQLWALMGIGLADATLLPMDPLDETVMLRQMVEGLKQEFGDILQEEGITLAHIEAVINNFEETAVSFSSFVGNLTDVSPLLARQLNDQLMLLEKCYINSQGSPVRPHVKNMMFGSSNFNQYEGVFAPGVRDAMWEAMQCSATCKQKKEPCRGTSCTGEGGTYADGTSSVRGTHVSEGSIDGPNTDGAKDNGTPKSGAFISRSSTSDAFINNGAYTSGASISGTSSNETPTSGTSTNSGASIPPNSRTPTTKGTATDINSSETAPCDQNTCVKAWGLVKQQLSILQYVINSAVLTMKDIRQF